MNSILQGDLASLLTDALEAERIPYPLAIRRTELDTSDPFNPGSHDVDYAAQGWLDTYAATDIDGTLIRTTDVKAFALCSSITITPATTDKLLANSKTYTIVSVQRDPAGACWVIQARV